jgi:hypothetical protein
LSQRNAAPAQEVLEEAELLLHARAGDLARKWYLAAALLTTVLLVGASAFLWFSPATPFLSAGITRHEAAAALAFGALGALLSVVLRANRITVEATAGPAIHVVEGSSRAFAGWLCGLVVLLAVKSNLMLGVVNGTPNNDSLLHLLAFIGGWSERFVPGLIRNVEKSVRPKPQGEGKGS